MQKKTKEKSVFSHQKIGAGSSECGGSFFHDYVPMEKEEGSFVGAEVSSRSKRTAAQTRLSYRDGVNGKG